MIRRVAGLVLWSCLWLTWGCHQAHSPQTSDSNTNWLTACSSDADCTGVASCLCGSCTRECDEASQCSAVADDAQCVSTGDPSVRERCEQYGAQGAAAICVSGSAQDAGTLRVGDASSVALTEDMTSSLDAEISSEDASLDAAAADSGNATLDAATDGETSKEACLTCMNGGRFECGSGRVTCECPVGITGGLCQTILPVRQLVAGDHHTCALLAPSRIECWGRNDRGQLGLGDVLARGDDAAETSASFAEVDLGTNVMVDRIAAGGAHTCAVFVDGSMRCWGDNSTGQLGLGDTNHRGDEAGEMGTSLPSLVLSSTDLDDVTAGANHTCVMHDDQKISCWGGNATGQLGLGNTLSRGEEAADDLLAFKVPLGKSVVATQVVAADGFTCATLASLGVKCWGGNQHGQLARGDTLTLGDEDGEMGDSLNTASLGELGVGVQQLVAKGRHACVRLEDRVRCWGKNDAGQALLGLTGDRGDDVSEIAKDMLDAQFAQIPQVLALGADHGCAILPTGALTCWGDNSAGQLGLGDTQARGDEPTELSSNLPQVSLPTGFVTALALGARHTCVVLDDAYVSCWGANGSGELGLGHTEVFGDDAGEIPSTLTKLTF